MFLRELQKPLLQLKGVGPAAVSGFQKLQISTIAQLLLHYPRDYEDHKTIAPLPSTGMELYGFPGVKKLKAGRLQTGSIQVNTIAEVTSHSYFGLRKKRTLKVSVKDSSGTGELLCFGRNFLAQKLIPGNKYYLYGTFQYNYGELQSSAFEVEHFGNEPENFGKILPVYSLAGNLTQGIVRRAVKQALREFGKYLEDELPQALIVENKLLKKQTAIQNIHFPESMEKLETSRLTLIYEELLYLQLIVLRRAFRRQSQKRPKRNFSDLLQRKLIQRLPYTLTPDQEKTLIEIMKDISSTKPMARLLQGDVGSGKTLVAFLASLPFVEAGIQAAFMAPTELLARQHAENGMKLLEPLGIKIAFLTGNVENRGRTFVLEALAAGDINLVIGTHALFTEAVRFKNLGLVIVDEQHRFGVLQRLNLMSKGDLPDLLLMTATPIPRTLALTAFGDLDISTIKTMPPGRKPVKTHLAVMGKEEKVYTWVRNELQKGRQAYFVYPLIEQSEKMSLKDAESMYEHLKTEIFPDFSIGLIHSRKPEEEIETTMGNFITGELKILVATTVVEVGVDVPNATCMVIEHAERFGLSALHQLRGRIGRGEHQSYAFLVYGTSLTEEAKQRLKVMKESNDGFYIANEDLKIRGPGEIIGTRQSGFFNL
ncbi:MAG: ATP-dependent DNA helicase RecG, partial [Spirochaetota bacterium]